MFKFFILILFIVPATVFAQGYEQYTTYTVKNGLPQSSIQDIIQDKEGFLWIATADGLCRFDGYTFKPYKHDPTNPRSPNSDWHNHFYTDHSGKLWMTSYNGISYYDSAADNFVNVLTFDTKTVVTTENRIYGEDEHYLWAGLSNWGLIKVDKRTFKIEKIKLPGITDPTEVLSWYRGFMEGGKIWIVTKTDFFIYTLRTGEVKKINIPMKGLINLGGNFALGFDYEKVLLIDKRNLSVQQITVTEDGSDHNIGGMLQLPDKNVVLCSVTKGLFFLDVAQKKVVRRMPFTGNGTEKKILQAACAYTDRSGNLWIGTSGDGMLKIDKPYRKFRVYRSENPKSNQVFSIYADSASVYIGCGANGMDIYSRENGFVRNVVVNKGMPAILNNAGVTIPVGGNQLLLLANSSKTGGSNQPLLYNFSTGKISSFGPQVLNTYKKLWGQGNFRNFAFPYSDRSFLTNAGEYLVSLNRDAGGNFTADTVHHFAGQMLSCCYRDTKNRLWIGTYKGAYIQINHRWEKIGLPKPVEIKCIVEDPEGNTWLSSGIGIYVLNKEHRLIQFFNQQRYLLNEHVYAMLADDEGNIWFSHNKGLSVYLWKKKKFKHFVEADGLQSAEFNSSAYFKAANGELFFGGINGTTSFFPREILDNPNSPKPVLTAIGLFDQPYKSGISPWNTRSLTLPYTSNSLSFDFTLPEYSDPGRNRYAYFMTGVDKKWINSGERRFTRYPGLQPGTYMFKIKAANNNGVWSKYPTTLLITIVPPFWQRWWFILLLSVSILALVWLGVSQLQNLRLRQKMRALELRQKVQVERERISRDLHDNVGTQLSLISKNIEDLLHPLNVASTEDKDRSLKTMSQTSKEVIATLRETIWALNKETITLEEFSDKLKSFAKKQTQLFTALTLKYDENIAGDGLSLSPNEAIHLFRICQEAIANALKYAEATLLSITLNEFDQKYRIVIADNGKGFMHEQQSDTPGYGIGNMKFRAAEIGCSLAVKSSESSGTEILIVKE